MTELCGIVSSMTRFTLLLASLAVVAASCAGTSTSAGTESNPVNDETTSSSTSTSIPLAAPVTSSTAVTDPTLPAAAGYDRLELAGTTTTTTAATESAAPGPPPEGPPAPDFTLALGEEGIDTFTLSEEAKPVFMVFWAEW